MRNILAIAQKEIKSYFTSPIGYVLIGFWAVLFGWFFMNILAIFLLNAARAGAQQFGGPPPTININQDMIRPLLYNVTILLLFVMPGITMRTYAEEKRAGTIELLLTSPVSDFQIIMGKFLGALALWVVMLAVTSIHIGILFVYGTPELKPIITGYIGLLLLGACFISTGLFISSLTKNQVVAFMATFSVFLFLWIINWVNSFAGPTVTAITGYLSIVDHYDDFSKGVIDTTHVIYYLSFITFGLFLTAKSVDSERWRG